MREAAGDKELTAVLGREDDALPLPERRAPRAEVNAHVEDLPLDDADELGLGVVDLEVEASQDPPHARGLVVLHEVDVDATRHEVGALVGLHEGAPLVAVRLGFDNNDPVD